MITQTTCFKVLYTQFATQNTQAQKELNHRDIGASMNNVVNNYKITS